jgi:hypothetical protein
MPSIQLTAPSGRYLSFVEREEIAAPVTAKLRIPLIVRIDDPWLAETWRAEQFGRHAGGSDALFAADTVGKYEMTARRRLPSSPTMTLLAPEDVSFAATCGGRAM